MNKKKIAIIITAVIVVAAIVISLILLLGNSEKFNVKLTETSEKLTVKITGNTDGLSWIADNKSENIVAVSEVSNGNKAVFEITPKGEAVSFYDVMFTLGDSDFIVYVKGMIDENGGITDSNYGYFDSCKVSEVLNESGNVSAYVNGTALEISFPDDGKEGFNWKYEESENVTVTLSYFGDDGVKYSVSATEEGTYNTVFFNPAIAKHVELKFSIDKDGVYNPEKITVSDYTPE